MLIRSFYYALVFLFSSLHAAETLAQEVVGTLNGELTVAAGAANYSIPISVAPGRAGMQPELSLHFSSNAGNGMMGIGWSLGGLSSITRCSATLVQDGFWGAVKFDQKDRYCIDGQRLIPINGENGEVGTEYRTEVDSYAQIISYGGTDYNPTYWLVKTKSGRTMKYGEGSSSVPVRDENTILTWSLNQMNDTTGKNFVNYSYDIENGVQYLTGISYKGGRVDIVYDNARFDAHTSYFHGKAVTMKRRMAQIKTSSENALIRDYQITYYGSSEIDRFSRIQSITACDVNENCLKESTFSWSTAGNSSHSGLHKLATINNKQGMLFKNIDDINHDGINDIVLAKGDAAGLRVSSFLGQGDMSFGANLTSNETGNWTKWAILGLYDVNGDGSGDIIAEHHGSSGLRIGVKLSNGDGTFAAVESSPAHAVHNEWVFVGMQDLNNDGLPDALWQYRKIGKAIQLAARLSLGDGSFGELEKSTVSIASNYVTYWTFAGMHDSNLDGKPDAIWQKKDSSGLHVAVSLAEDGDDGKFAMLETSRVDTSDNHKKSSHRFSGMGDVNGDGLNDAVWTYTGSSGFRTYVSLANGDGTFAYRVWSKPSGANRKKYFVIGLVDVNGDGLSDVVWHKKNRDSVRVSLSLGNGAFSGLKSSETIKLTSDTRFHSFADANGDGKMDLIYIRYTSSSGRRAYISHGRNNGTFSKGYGYAANGLGYSSLVGVHDVNSDGIDDLVWFNNRLESGKLLGVNISKKQTPRLTQIIDAQGKSTSMHYLPLSNPAVYTKGSDAVFPVVDQIGSQHVVSSVSVDNGGTSDGYTYRKKTMYHYEGLKSHVLGRGSYGYSRITESYAEGGFSTTSGGMSVTNKRIITFDQRDFPYTGRITREEELHRNTGNFERTNLMRTTFEALEKPAGFYQVNKTRVEKFAYELGVSEFHLRTVTLRRQIDDYGNAGRTDVVNVAGGDAFSTITINNYSNDENRWFLGRVTKSSTIYRSPYLADEQYIKQFTYNANTGLLESTKVVSSVNGQIPNIQILFYDEFGLVTRKETHATGNTTRFITHQYDSQGRLIKSCNANAECVDKDYTPEGWLASSTDVNGIATTWDYDGFGRKIAENRADGTSTITERYLADSGLCGELAHSAYRCDMIQTSGGSPVITQYDNLDRVVRHIKVGFDGRNILSDTEYNLRGLVSRVSREYYQGDSKRWANTEYDNLDRIIRMTEPGTHGSITEVITKYNGLSSTVRRGPNQLATTTILNAVGQKTRVQEEEGAYIEYTYKNDGKLLTTQVNGDPATKITLSYDEYGRKIGMDDPDMGQWQYQYNAFGELTRQTDAKNQASIMQYDVLGRMIKRTEPEGISTWTYGDSSAPAGSIGQLLQEKMPGITKDYTYDNLGRSSSTTTRISGVGSFTARQFYDEFGRVSRVSYPGNLGFYTDNVYNERGFLAAVQGLRALAESHDYAQLQPLISQAANLADEYLTRANRLRTLGEYYKDLQNSYRDLANTGTFTTSLEERRAELTADIAKGQSFSSEFIGHINNAMAELEVVIQLINTDVNNYESITQQLVVLAEQTLIAADSDFAASRSFNGAAESYDDFNAEQAGNIITYWKAVDVDASGRVSAEVYGNGVVNNYAYNQATGELDSIHSSLVSQSPIRHLEYQYDAHKNVTLRHDLVNDIQERYEYDRLDRLTAAHVNSTRYSTTNDLNNSQTLIYDAFGNIVNKSDVGDYTYGDNGAGIHAVTRAGNKTYAYDANGNMISGDGRTIEWSSFNKPTKITQNNRSATFSYGVDRARYKKVNHLGDTTLYLGLSEKLTKTNGDTEDKHYIYANGQLVAEHIVSSQDGIQTRYLHKDALGTIDLVTDAHGNVVDRRSFDAWGKLREFPWKANATITDPLYLTQLPFTNKGYTGHENVQEVDLIHMNGRMYDATLARFVSADTFIQSGSHSQSYNRYSYVWNNPMKYTDPTGHFAEKVGNFVRNTWNAVKRTTRRVWDRVKRAVRESRNRTSRKDHLQPGVSQANGFFTGTCASVAGVACTAPETTYATSPFSGTELSLDDILGYTAENHLWGYDTRMRTGISDEELLERLENPSYYQRPDPRNGEAISPWILPDLIGGLSVIKGVKTAVSSLRRAQILGTSTTFREGALTVRTAEALRNSRILSSLRGSGKELLDEVVDNPYKAMRDLAGGFGFGVPGNSNSKMTLIGVSVRRAGDQVVDHIPDWLKILN